MKSRNTDRKQQQATAQWQLLVMPDMRTKVRFNDRFFVPLGPVIIYEAIRKAGIDVSYIDLNLWYWEYAHRCFDGSDDRNSITDLIKSLPEASMRAQRVSRDNFHANLLKRISPNVATLLSSDFASFDAKDSTVQLCIHLPLWLKALGIPYVILGGSRCKRSFARWIMEHSPGLDCVFYHEVWSKSNEEDLPRFLIQSPSCSNPNPRNDRFHCILRQDGNLVDAADGELETKNPKAGLYRPSISHALVSQHSYSVFDVLPAELNNELKTFGFSSRTLYPGIVQTMTSDGCPNSCAFCDVSSLNLQTLTPSAVVDYLEKTNEETGARFFFFLNRQLNMKPRYVEEFCEQILSRGLNILWCDSFNLDMWTPGLGELLRKAGCIRACAGIETVSPRLRKLVGRPCDLDLVKGAIHELHHCGIWVMLNLIIGLPHEKAEDVAAAKQFLEDISSQFQWILLSRFKLYSNSPFALFPEKYGLEIESGPAEIIHDNPSFSAYSLRYREIGGRSWQECQKHIGDTYKELEIYADPVFQRLSGNFPLLAVCYEHFSSKPEIMQFLSSLTQIVKLRKLQDHIGYKC